MVVDGLLQGKISVYECHYILECKFFNGLRKDYIDTYFIKRPSAIKFGHLMKTKN